MSVAGSDFERTNPPIVRRRHSARSNAALFFALVLPLLLTACLSAPSAEEATEAVLNLRKYGDWAWVWAILLIWADILLPIPQTSVIAALGIIYGPILGGLIGSFALITGGLLGYLLMLTSARQLVLRFAAPQWLERMEGLFERKGVWVIVLTRSLPKSLAEIATFLAGIARMPLLKFITALTVGSVPIAFAFAAIGAGLADQPIVALIVSFVLPIILLPIALYILKVE